MDGLKSHHAYMDIHHSHGYPEQMGDMEMLQSRYLTETDLRDFGFRSIGVDVRISSDARIYGCENISIGNNVRIDDFAILAAVDGSITIGNHVFVARGSHLSGTLGIVIHDFTTMAANIVIYSASDDYSGDFLTGQAVPRKYTTRVGGQVTIGRHAVIGSGSTIIGPCDIGEGCSLGSMTLAYRDLEPWGVYVGIPARRLKERRRNLLALEEEYARELQAKGGYQG